MKNIAVIFAIILVLLFYGCITKTESSEFTVKVNIKNWASKPFAEPSVQSSTQEIPIKNGQMFLDLFKVTGVMNDSVLIEFNETLVVVGEPIGKKSEKNPIWITLGDEACFRTRSYDGGTDYCLTLKKFA